MSEVNLSVLFRQEIRKGVYNFDIIAMEEGKVKSSIVGYGIVDVKREIRMTTLNSILHIPEETMSKLERILLEQAKMVDSFCG